MEELKLVAPSLDDKESALSMLEEIKKIDAGLPWQYSGLANLEESSSYEEWIQEKENEKSGINLREGFVPATTLFLKRLSDNKICGSISIRHELNEFLLNFGGHIGYSVTPSERGKGYGKLQLKKAIEEAKKLNITSCLITADVENIANEILLMKNGRICMSGTMSDILLTMSDKVWIVRAAKNEGDSFLKKYKVSNMKLYEDMIEIRLISHDKPTDSAIPVKTTLEDLFLYYFGEKVSE